MATPLFSLFITVPKLRKIEQKRMSAALFESGIRQRKGRISMSDSKFSVYDITNGHTFVNAAWTFQQAHLMMRDAVAEETSRIDDFRADIGDNYAKIFNNDGQIIKAYEIIEEDTNYL